MTLPMVIGDAAQEGDRDTVIAWLDAGGSIDDFDEEGYSLLHCCACGEHEGNFQGDVIGDAHVALARHLIALGADVNNSTSAGYTAFHYIVQRKREPQAVLEMLSLFLGAGANVNARTVTSYGGSMPLDLAIQHDPSTLRTTIVTELLRAGASLDACRGDESAEDVVRTKELSRPNLAENEDWRAIKRLVAGVRQHGSYKRYARSFHRDVLAVRGLAQRGKLLTDDPVLSFLARRADNGVAWKILEYWRATN